MAGNVWEWTATAWTDRRTADARTRRAMLLRPASDASESDRFVIKGGSHLCAPSYCHRYRPAARQGHGVRNTTSHVGFRCVVDV